MRKSIFILLVALATSGCVEEKEGGPISISEHGYFPLHIGNSWEYSTLGYDSDLYVSKSEIVSKVFIDNFEYALMTRTRTIYSGTHIDSSYYRVDTNGYVFVRENESEYNVYRLNAADGFTWTIDKPFSSFPDPELSFIQEIRLNIESVNLNGTVIEQCKRYDHDVKDVYDEEGYSILGPGLGIIQSGNYFGGLHTVLKRAVIDGQEYNF